MIKFENECWNVCQVVAHSAEDQEVSGSNPTLAQDEFLWAQEMNLCDTTRPRYELVP